MESKLSVADYIVFAAVLMISAGIGLYYRFTGGKQNTVKEYVLADRSMPAWPVAFSLMASFMSAVTLLGVTSENYNYGTQFMVINLSYVIATPIICYVYLPVFYNAGRASAYEYLEQRFGRMTRVAASLAFTLQMVLYNGIVLFAPSLALSAVTGLNKLLSVLSIGFVCTFYSTIGGIKAVLITDVFQSLLMFAAVYIVIIHGAVTMGWEEVFNRVKDGERFEFLTFSVDPTVRHTVWTQIIGGAFIYLSLYAVNQAQVQRLLTVKDLKASQMSLWISLPILNLLSFSTCWAGLTIYAKYNTCDPISQGAICQNDQLLPYYVANNLNIYQGIVGLFIAGLLSGSLSTLSSSINSLAAVTLEDYIKPCLKEPPGPTRAAILTKVLALAFGMLSIGFSFVAENFKGVLQASLTVFGVVGGPLLGLFTLGMLVPRASERSSLAGFLISLAIGLWIGFGGPKPPVLTKPMRIDGCESMADLCSRGNSTSEPPDEYFYLYRISYMWYTLIGFAIAMIIGIIGSFIFPEKKDLDPTLFSPVISRFVKRRPSSSDVVMTQIQ